MTNSTLQKQLIQTGAAFAGIAVLLGAIGTHEIKPIISDGDFAIFETAVKYQFMHALSILVIAFGLRKLDESVARAVFYLFVTGILLFSGALFLLSTSSVWAHVRMKWFGAIAPIGGLSFVTGWFYLAFKGYKPGTHGVSTSQKIMTMHKRKTAETTQDTQA